MQNDVGQVGDAFRDQTPAHGKGDKAGVFADHKKMKGIAGGGSRLGEILMAEGEGVRIHDERSRLPLGLCLFQGPQVAAEAVPAVLHKDEGVLHAGNLIKAKIPEEPGALDLCVKEQMQVAAGALHLDEVGDDLIQEPLALMCMADGEAPQGVAEAAAGADDVVVFIEQGADVVEAGVPADALLFQQGVDLGKGTFVGEGHLRKRIVRHGDVPPF